MKQKKRIPTDGEPIAWTSPFAALTHMNVAQAVPRQPARDHSDPPVAPKTHRGRVDIMRQRAQRAGKTVTVVTGFVGIGQAEKERLAKEMQRACGAGGTVKEGRIEIQGDHREVVAGILTHAGFRPVFAGG
jgi:translation initiation factor 1